MSKKLQDLLSKAERHLRASEASVRSDYEEAARRRSDNERHRELRSLLVKLQADEKDCAEDPELRAGLESELEAAAEKLLEAVEAFLDESPTARVLPSPPAPRSPAASMSGALHPTPSSTGLPSSLVAWRFTHLDHDFPKVWVKVEDPEGFLWVLKRLCDFESSTWQELHQRRNFHDWDPREWDEAARGRLEELELDDRAGWYQLRLSKKGRLFGFHLEGIFHIVWWDRDHEVYAVSR